MCAPARDAPACGRRNAPRRHRAGQGNGGGGGGAGVRKAQTGGTTSDTCGERGARLRRASGVAVRRRRRGGRKSEGTRTSGAPRWRATARRRRPRAASALLQACLSAQGGGRRAGLSPTGFFRWCLFFCSCQQTHGRARRRSGGGRDPPSTRRRLPSPSPSGRRARSDRLAPAPQSLQATSADAACRGEACGSRCRPWRRPAAWWCTRSCCYPW